MTTEYAARKNEECYEHVYILHHPDEEREACRPLRTAPAYDRQKELGAQFGCVNGWERPNYYGPLDAPDSFDHMTAAVSAVAVGGNTPRTRPSAVREGVGLIDATAFTKHLRKGTRRHTILGLVYLQQTAQSGSHQPDLCADRCGHNTHRIYHRAAWQRMNITLSPPAHGKPMTAIICARRSRIKPAEFGYIVRAGCHHHNGAYSPLLVRNRAMC